MNPFGPSVFDLALSYLIEKGEGSAYTDDPDDAGGPTKFGVTQKSYSQFLGFEVTPEMMQALTVDDARPFYRNQYWAPLNCSRMKDPGIAIAVFDCGVLYGLVQTGVMVQQALNLTGGLLRTDGVIGDRTLDLLNKVSRVTLLVNLERFVLLRIDHLVKTHPRNEKFRAGWENRARRLLTLNQDTTFNKQNT